MKKKETELSVGTLYTESWHIFKKEWSFVVAIVLLIVVIVFGVYQLQIILGQREVDERIVNGVLIASESFFLFIFYGVLTIFLRLVHDEKVSYSVLWQGLREPYAFLSYIIATIILSIIFLVGFTLFVAPGIIASIFLGFTRLIIVDNGTDPLTAMWKSIRYTGKNFVPVCIYLASVVIVNIVGVLTFGFGLLVTIPLTTIGFTLLYTKIAKWSSE